MPCHNSVKTATGKFTLYTEQVSRCEAKRKCRRKGKILAPITNREDLKAIKSLQRHNEFSRECPHGHGHFSYYHVGLDVQNIGGKLIRGFTDGTKWDDCEMSGLYHVINFPEKPIAMFGTDLQESLMIREETEEAAKYRYICLKPASEKKEKKHSSKSKGDASSESLVNETSQNYFGLVGGVCGAVLAVAVCVIAVRTWNKMKRCEREMNECQEKVRRCEKVMDDMKKAASNQCQASRF